MDRRLIIDDSLNEIRNSKPSRGKRCGDNSLDVLLVEDYPMARLLLATQIGMLGHRVHCAEHGVTGLNAVKELVFDLILTDIDMPHMDGLELIRRIRQYEHENGYSRTMIAAVTAGGDKEQCYKAGACEYLLKPASIDQLEDLIAKCRGRLPEGGYCQSKPA